ncbi:endoplasmic reticulum metallopeptidase 1 isoform 1-T4 [Glossina fuscipes fuscipes]
MKSKYETMKVIYYRSKLDWYWAPVFVAFWFLLFYIVVIHSFNNFPENIMIAEEMNNTDRFIGERAENLLMRLSKIGPKVVGSPANEQSAVQFLLNELSKIREDARHDIYIIQEDVQIASGNYVLWEMVNIYQSIQNVVVKVTPRNSESTSSILLNSHYDTVPGSSGAGDSGLMIAVMLETLRVITKRETNLKHSIVFLFNGAEENPLQGSHAFITQHEWAANVKAVINLDSAGSGGREILFQSGPGHPWLMKYYGAHIVHPYASTIAEELFQNGFVPSETDYRIFRDFGHIPGLDMAHSFNGFVYHTKYDRFTTIPRRTYQRTGDNVLALTKALANAVELEDPSKYAEGNIVFYDILGWFIIYYSDQTGVIINITVSVLFLLTLMIYIWNMANQTGMFRRRILLKFITIFGIQFVTINCALLMTVIIAIFLDAIGAPMSWFSKPWMIFGLYFCPIFFILGILPSIYLSHIKDYGLPLAYSIQLLMHSHCLLLTLLTIALVSLGIRSAFLIMLGVAFYTLSVILNITARFHKTNFLWLIPHNLCQISPFLFYTYICYAFYTTFIPMEGRDGANRNPELLIGGFTVVICFLFAPFLVNLLSLVRKSKTILSCFGIIWIIFMGVAVSPMGFPYVEKEAPQRFYAVHSTRTFHDDSPAMLVKYEDFGFYVVPVDRRPQSIDFMFQETNFTKSDANFCETEIMCGFPIYSSRWLEWRNQSFWVEASQPTKIGWATLKIISKEQTSSKTILFTLEVAGPHHISIFIQPMHGVKLMDWSFTKIPLEQNFTAPYYLYFSYALDPTPLRFHLEFKWETEDWSGSTFAIALIGHKVDDINTTDDFREFLTSFPAWAHVSAWTSSYESWKL